MILRNKSGVLKNLHSCRFFSLEFLLCKNSIALETAASRGEPSPLCGSVEYTMPQKNGRFYAYQE